MMRQHVTFPEWRAKIRAELNGRVSGTDLLLIEAVRRKLSAPNYGRLGLGSADECEGRN